MTRTDPARVARRAVLRSALDVIVPDAIEADLLRAILWTGVEGQEAWHRVRAQTGEAAFVVQRLQPAQKALLPLLHLASQRNRIALPRHDATYLHTAYFREELRGHAYRRILNDVLSALADAHVPAIVLKGCALADSVYPDAASRHAHGIELMIRDEDRARLGAPLEKAGFQSARNDQDRRRHMVPFTWRHSQGLPLDVRMRLLDQPYYTVPTADLWARSRSLKALHAHARILCPEHNLLHVLASAATSGSRTNLRWACDAWYLVERHGDDLDWPLLLETAQRARLVLPLSVTTRFLGRGLRAGVPRSMLGALNAGAAAADDVAHEVALLGAVTGAHARMRKIIARTPGMRARVAVVRPLIAPSPKAVRALYGTASWSPAYYALRPVGYVVRRLRRLHKARYRLPWRPRPPQKVVPNNVLPRP